MRVLVCGGRNFDNPACVKVVLNEFVKPDDVIISGMAKGADALAADYAIKNRIKLEAYYANWEKYGRAAGPIRNTQMLKEGRPDLIIAFPGGTGTGSHEANC